MNTNDFYKQLMSEYTFDHEKIKKAAIKNAAMPDVKADVKKRRIPLAIKWASGSAAAAAVIITSVIGINAVMSKGGAPISVSSSMSVSERFHLAAEIYDNTDEDDLADMFYYVTFKESETPDDMQGILSHADSTGKIKVISVYCEGKGEIVGNDGIKQLFQSGEKNIIAAKIMCPAKLFKKLSNDPMIYLVESADTFDENNLLFSPIDTSGDYEDYPYDPVPGDTTFPPEN